MPSPSPTIIRAVKLKRRPPLTTLATRLIVTRRSMYGVLSWAAPPRPPSRRSRRSPERSPPDPEFGPPPSRRARPGIRRSLPYQWSDPASRSSGCSCASELQTALAGGVGERRDPAVVVEAAPVEHHCGDARLARALGDELADRGRAGLLVAVEPTHVGLQRGRRGQRVARQVVDQLDDDVPRAALHGQARPLGRALDLLAQPRVPLGDGGPALARDLRTRALLGVG